MRSGGSRPWADTIGSRGACRTIATSRCPTSLASTSSISPTPAARSPSSKDDSVNIIKENPYKLIEDIRGVGFKTADEIALKNGISKEDGLRILKGVEYVLNYEAQKSGHTCLPKESLMEKAEILLEVSKDLIENNFKFMILKSVLNFDMDMVYSSFYHTCEVRAANKLVKFVMNRLDGHDELQIYTETDEVSEAQGIKLTDEQKQTIQNTSKIGRASCRERV